MENKILFINACLRECSRTEELSHHLADNLEGTVKEIDLYSENILPLDEEGMKKRESRNYSEEDLKYAKQFADADTILVAAPFWDLSFPSVLKIYFENITISGVTFEYSDNGRPVGLCKAKKLYYVTTSGGYIGENNFGFDYIKALCENFFGISDVSFFSAEGLDIFGNDISGIMADARERITKYFQKNV